MTKKIVKWAREVASGQVVGATISIEADTLLRLVTTHPEILAAGLKIPAYADVLIGNIKVEGNMEDVRLRPIEEEGMLMITWILEDTDD